MNGISLFDLHCDTVTECCKRNLSLRENDLHISLNRSMRYDKYIQVFAIWIPDDISGNEAHDYFLRNAEYFHRSVSENSDVVVECTDSGGLSKIRASQKHGAILSIENGNALCGKIENLYEAYELGVRLITLTWNGDNELGCGSVAGGKGGLTDFGRIVVSNMDRLGMTVDVSHLNERGFYDVAELSNKPFIASHSNYSDVFPHPRNLTRDQLNVIIQHGGLVGLNLYKAFLGNHGGYDDCYAQICYSLDNGGYDVLALGCDFDGADIAPELAGIERLEGLYEYLLCRNIDEETLRKIFFDNAYNFFIKNMTGKAGN